MWGKEGRGGREWGEREWGKMDGERRWGMDRPAGLGGAEVGADDLGAGVLVADVDGPYPRAGADVEDAAGLGAEGGEEELAVHGQAEHAVGEVQPIEFALVG